MQRKADVSTSHIHALDRAISSLQQEMSLQAFTVASAETSDHSIDDSLRRILLRLESVTLEADNAVAGSKELVASHIRQEVEYPTSRRT